jgi:hypothetical protein
VAITLNEEEDEWSKYFSVSPTPSIKDVGDSSDEDWSKYFGVSGSGLTSGMTAFESSIERMKKSYGSFAGEYVPDLIGKENVPDVVMEWGEEVAREAEQKLSSYRSKYRPDITEEEWQNILPSLLEKVQENAALTGSLLTTSVAAGIIAAYSPVIGTGVLIASAFATFPPIVDEVFEEQAAIAGIDTRDMTPEQKKIAWATAMQNLAIEMANPIRWFKATKGAPIPKNAKELAEYIRKADRQTLATQLKLGAKEAGKSALVGGGQEVLQSLNIARGTEPGISAKPWGEYFTEGLVGTTMGGTAGTMPGYSVARSENKLLDRGTDYLNFLDKQSLFKASEDYNKQFRELAASAEGDFSPIFDVEPELFNMPSSKSRVGVLGSAVAKLGFKRSTDTFNLQDARASKAAKLGKDINEVSLTGRDVSLLRTDIFAMFGEVESGSGEFGQAPSFNTLRHSLVGEYSKLFNKVYRTWSGSIPGAGEFGARMRKDVDNYLAAILENKDVAIHRANVSKSYGATEVNAMTSDFISLKNELQKTLIKLRKEGLDIGEIKNYRPRVWDRKVIQANREQFITDLIEIIGISDTKNKHGEVIRTARENAEDIYHKFVNGTSPDILTSEQIKAETLAGKGLGKKAFEKERNKQWDNLPDKYRKQGTFKGLQEYFISAATRAASTRVFGDKGKKLHKAVNEAMKRGILTKNKAKEVWDMYDAEHHLFKRPETEGGESLMKLSKIATTASAITYLGLAPISSITEPAWISSRVGVANMLKATPTVAAHVLKGMQRTLWGGKSGKEAPESFGRMLINLLGMATNPRESEKLNKMFAGDSNVVLNAYFRSFGGLFLTQYTNFVRVWTAAAGLKMIQGYASKMPGLKGHKLAAWKNELKENRMTLNDFKEIIRLNGGPKIDILNDQFMDSRFTLENGTKVSVKDLLIPWLRKITTDVALEPHVGNRPLWMSDPRMQVLAQLKSFPILFSNTIMKRTMRQINPRVCTPSIVGAVGALGSAATALALGAMALAIKDAIRDSDRERGAVDIISSIGVPYLDADVSRLASVPAAEVAGRFSKSIVELLGGEPDDILEDLIDLLTRATVGAIFAEQLDE